MILSVARDRTAVIETGRKSLSCVGLEVFETGQILACFHWSTVSGAGNNLKVEGHKMPARRAGRNIFDVPQHFSVVHPTGERGNEKLSGHSREARVSLQV